MVVSPATTLNFHSVRPWTNILQSAGVEQRNWKTTCLLHADGPVPAGLIVNVPSDTTVRSSLSCPYTVEVHSGGRADRRGKPDHPSGIPVFPAPMQSSTPCPYDGSSEWLFL